MLVITAVAAATSFFSHCTQAGAHKATAAASRVKRIFPDIDAEGVVLSIPLPGHPVSERDEESARQVMNAFGFFPAAVTLCFRVTLSNIPLIFHHIIITPPHHHHHTCTHMHLQATAKLSELVDSHDCVFLLTDTRESRWLPTVLCAAADKVRRVVRIWL